MFVRSFLPPRACRSQNIGTNGFTATQNFFYITMVFAKNASFISYGVICLPRMPPTTLKPQKTDTKGISGCLNTLIFAILTKNASFKSYGTFAYLLRAHIRNINMRMYITSARGHELSGRIRYSRTRLSTINTHTKNNNKTPPKKPK